ncbi:hypothetical protein DFJ58DRAFT_725230 [Suillus subalutaceus]|uniref:uncharacterized protein n=1 Tax=Suillus subalutaceus TaxID=48586 RepID=UPI001B864AB6|nr:uncharacterized protein DFJ58DRAFT_725230 [Suillus subalutaceus]KAG1862745.1 hypothetical protein DFJ58DRAFT_725230 [Suillus subalutaceus]
MLTFKQYTKVIDVWSVGLHLGRDAFWKASVPRCSRDTNAGRVLRHYHTQIARSYSSSSFPQPQAICANLPQANPLAVDFLAKTLTFDPKKRITVEEALAHPSIEAYVYFLLLERT